jgi:hypothetical protein
VALDRQTEGGQRELSRLQVGIDEASKKLAEATSGYNSKLTKARASSLISLLALILARI